MRKYRLTFEFKDTKAEAEAFCDLINKNYTSYMKKHYKAYFTPWHGCERYICWFVR